MKQVYLDNGATAYPKAPGVAEAMANYLLQVGTNVGRGAYDLSYAAENVVFETRELLAEFFSFDKPENVIFTKNVTESLNVLIKGILKEGDHAVVSSIEHNAVMRPLHAMGDKITYTRAKCDSKGRLDIEDFKNALQANTKAVIMSHASNVSGTILDLEAVGKICKEKEIFFIIDTAQTAGFLDTDFYKLNASALAFTGHKALLGPQGMGGFLIDDAMVEEMTTLIEGGTGSLSDEEIQPEYMPDKFEAGTLNIPGIYGLHTALKYLLDLGIDKIRERELALTEYFLAGLEKIENINLIGLPTIEGRTGVVSLDFLKEDNGIAAFELGKEYGIMTRSGLHCAPSAHKTLGTFPRGTVRFSLSQTTSLEELDYALDAINKIANK